MDRFLVAIIGIPAAFLMVYFRYEIKNFFGEVSFAEKFFGMGGTHTFILLLALAVFILSLMYAFGTLQEFLKSTLGAFFPA